MITTDEAKAIAALYHSPSPADRNITALSHGLLDRIDWDDLIGEIERTIVDFPDETDLADLLEWAEDQRDDQPQRLSEYEALEQYRDMLDEVYGTVTIAGIEYDTSRTLEMVDEIAFRVGFSDWLDAQGLELE